MSTRHRSRRGRGLGGSSFSAMLPVIALVPVWLLALLVFWFFARLWWDLPFAQFAAGHLVAGFVMFLRPVQSMLTMRLLGAHPPFPEQAIRLEPAWRSVAQQLHLPPRRFRLAVLDSHELNAFACGGSLLVVTSYAIDVLPRDEMTGVLAHELAHHLGFHTVALTLRQWMSLPIYLLAEIGFFLESVATAATSSFAHQSVALRVVGGLVSGILRAFSWVFLVGLITSNALANTVGKGAEFDADRRAVEMGFGKELAVALRRVSSETLPTSATQHRGRVANSHPSPRTRMRRIETLRRVGS